MKRAKNALYFIPALLLIVIDQLVKLWVRGNIPLGEARTFLPGLLDLTYWQNTGAAFSLFSAHTWVLTLISVVAAAAIIVVMVKPLFTKPLGQIALALVLGGAVGNLIDRALLGYVTDMFQTTFMNFAVFNVADMGVVVGGILVCVYVLVFYDKQNGDKHAAL